MNRQFILKELETIYNGIASYNNIKLREDMSLYHSCCSSCVQLNSLNLLNWFILIEEEFGIEITEKEKTVADIIDKIIQF